MLPLVDRGARPLDPADPTSGLEGAVVAGHPIELVSGCSDATAEAALQEARRLVEEERVHILLGPLWGAEGIAVADYSKEHPDVTFVNGSSASQDTTLKVRSANFFRFSTDAVQWTAGLGAYAYDVLGWRTAVTIGDDYDFPYLQVAGFVAEFCSRGGRILERLWPQQGEDDLSSLVRRIPSEADGFFLATGATGVVAFVRQYPELERNLADDVVGGVFMTDPVIPQEIGADRLLGVATAGPTADDSEAEAYAHYARRLREAYPDYAANPASVFTYGYYVNMEAVLRALEQAGGVDDPQAFRAALAGVVVEGPFGRVVLDADRQAIADNYVRRLADRNGDGSLELETIATAREVDAAFDGVFSHETPTPSRESPACAAGAPAASTRGIVEAAAG
jgi:branched-chain amino acid transport system substrate-binding protein